MSEELKLASSCVDVVELGKPLECYQIPNSGFEGSGAPKVRLAVQNLWLANYK